MQGIPVTTNNTFLIAHPLLVLFFIEFRKHDFINEGKRREYFENFMIEKMNKNFINEKCAKIALISNEEFIYYIAINYSWHFE